MIVRKTKKRVKTLQNVDNSVDCVNYSHNKSESIKIKCENRQIRES